MKHDVSQEELCVILAALLHDIGKAVMRATAGTKKERNKERNRDYGYTHSRFTHDFLKEIIKEIIPNLDSFWEEIIEVASKHHVPQNVKDKKLSKLTTILMFADRKSASERYGNRNTSGQRYLISQFNAIDLSGNVTENDENYCHSEKFEDGFYHGRYLWKELKLTKSALCPVKLKSMKKRQPGVAKNLAELRDQLKEVLANFATTGNLRLWISKLLNILIKDVGLVPTPYWRYKCTDISIYDHLRMTAAIAHIAYKTVKNKLDTLTANEIYFKKSGKENGELVDKQVLLIKGDITGIQKFIYDFASPKGGKGSAHLLRGRSAFVTMLNHFIAHYMLKELGLYEPNLIYAGGGHFVILANEEDEENARKIAAGFHKWLQKETHGILGFVLASTQVEFNKIGTSFDSKMGELEEQLNKAKLQAPKSDLPGFKKMEGGDVCQLCHMPIMGEPKQFRGLNLCESCYSYVKLGETLAKNPNAYIIFFNKDLNGVGLTKKFKDEDEQSRRPGKQSNKFLIWRKDIKLGEKTDEAEVLGSILYGVHSIKELKKFEETDPERSIYLEKFENDGHVLAIKGFGADAFDRSEYGAILGASAFPTWENVDDQKVDGWPDSVKSRMATYYDSWDELKKTIDKGNLVSFDVLVLASKGPAKLGFFRADLDLLGAIFAAGLPYASPSRIATLSTFLDLFFAGYTNNIVREINDEIMGSWKDGDEFHDIFKKSISGVLYPVYLGGDDLFVIGPWNAVIDFAVRLYKYFRDFAVKNNSVNISGGLFIAGPKFPVRRAAELSAQALSRAKSASHAAFSEMLERGDEKIEEFGHMFAFGRVLKFSEFTEAVKSGKELVEMVEEGSVSRRLIHALRLALHQNSEPVDGSPHNRRLSPMFWPMAYYSVVRNVDSQGKQQEVLEILHRVMDMDAGKQEAALNVTLSYAAQAFRE